MLRVAIFNGFPFHYEVMGYLIHWCQTKGHRLIIYTETRDDYGWFDWYRARFDPDLDLRPVTAFLKESHNYHLIFLPTDDDRHFKEEWLKFYNLSRNVVAIDHIDRNRRPSIAKHLKLRYYGPDVSYAYPMYPIYLDSQGQPFVPDDSRSVVELPKFTGGTHIYVQGTPSATYDWEILMELSRSTEITFHIASRAVPAEYKQFSRAVFYEKIDARALLGIMYQCHFAFYCLAPQACHLTESCSGVVAMAYNCGTSLLINSRVAAAYDFKSSVLYPNLDSDHAIRKNLIRAECQERTGALDRELRTFFPNYFGAPSLPVFNSKSFKETPGWGSSEALTKIPKILHLMWLSPDNAPVPDKYLPNVTQYRDYNPDFEFKIWTNENAMAFLDNVDPRYSAFFESLNLVISRCDFLRMLLIYYLGGIYSDLDFYCLRHLGPLLQNKDLIIFKELPEHEPLFDQLFNGFVGAAPRHPFIGGWLEWMMTTITPQLPLPSNLVMKTTGPVAFWQYYNSLSEKPALSDKCDVTPYTNKQLRSAACPPGDPFVYTLWNEGTVWGADSEITAQQLGLIIFVSILILIVGIVISRIR